MLMCKMPGFSLKFTVNNALSNKAWNAGTTYYVPVVVQYSVCRMHTAVGLTTATYVAYTRQQASQRTTDCVASKCTSVPRMDSSDSWVTQSASSTGSTLADGMV